MLKCNYCRLMVKKKRVKFTQGSLGDNVYFFSLDLLSGLYAGVGQKAAEVHGEFRLNGNEAHLLKGKQVE